MRFDLPDGEPVDSRALLLNTAGSPLRHYLRMEIKGSNLPRLTSPLRIHCFDLEVNVRLLRQRRFDQDEDEL